MKMSLVIHSAPGYRYESQFIHGVHSASLHWHHCNSKTFQTIHNHGKLLSVCVITRRLDVSMHKVSGDPKDPDQARATISALERQVIEKAEIAGHMELDREPVGAGVASLREPVQILKTTIIAEKLTPADLGTTSRQPRGEGIRSRQPQVRRTKKYGNSDKRSTGSGKKPRNMLSSKENYWPKSWGSNSPSSKRGRSSR